MADEDIILWPPFITFMTKTGDYLTALTHSDFTFKHDTRKNILFTLSGMGRSYSYPEHP